MLRLVINMVVLFRNIYGTNGVIFDKYTITQGGPGVNVVRCIARSMKGQHEALRIRDWDGECTILSETWMSNKIYHAGYTYVEKPQPGIAQSFSFDSKIGESILDYPGERIWMLPTTFNKGQSLQIDMDMGLQEVSGMRYQIRLSNLTKAPFKTDTGPIGAILFSIALSRTKDRVKFGTFTGESWYHSPILSPFPFDYGTSNVITVNARGEDYQILFNGVERSVLPYPAPPEEGKSLHITTGVNKQWPLITKITIA